MALDLLTRLDPLRRVRCPFCFERSPAFRLHFRCESRECKGDYARMIPDPILSKALHGRRAAAPGATLRSAWWVDPGRDPIRGARRHFDWLVMPRTIDCPNCRKPTDAHLCPACHARLPDSVVTSDAGHIAIFGPQSVGKTTYVTVLLHELDERAGPDRGFVLDPLTDEIRDRYEREYHDLTYGGGGFGVGEAADASAFRVGHSATPSLETNRGVLQPLVYRLARRRGKGRNGAATLLSFFDTAGEDWEMNIELLRGEARYLQSARGLLFLIDPLRIREVATDPRLTLTEKESRVPPANYLNDARKLATFLDAVPSKTPLAIVLNKLDRWGALLGEGTALHEWARSIPTAPADRALDSTIDAEVRSALGRWGGVGFLEHVAATFPTHRFFACSALGDAAGPRDDEPQPLPTPLLVERPALWLLERQGIIPPA